MTEIADRADNLSPLKRAVLEIRELRSRIDEAERARREPIAIVGMGMRLPGGISDPEAFWDLLRDGTEAIGPIPPERWDAEAFYDPDPEAPGKMYTRHGAFVDPVDQFDPQFFGISPREAASMDPQQRLLLETAWEALERAGQAPDKLNGSQTGVFIGIANSDYFRMLASDLAAIDVYLATGNTLSVAAGRISYLLGLHGPSMAIDTACSSSLVAVHLAAQSLRSHECDLALAGGVNLILSPEANINFSKAQMMARDGHCKTFDAAADGYVRGEGCAVIVLKRLSDALASGDNILAVIRGSAVNQDGRSSGLTAPNGPAQEAVIRTALANGGIASHEVSYVEAHGTGTPLGDPIEIQALGAVLGADRPADRPLLVGSVKTNVGHLESAAGVVGLIKVVLALHHSQIPPHLHFRTPNPHIPWNTLPITIPTALTPWPVGERRRIAGISSFGFSGTNAHVLIEEAPAAREPVASDARPLQLLTLSAKSAAALRVLALRYQNWIAQRPDLALADLCHTANVGRAQFEQRLAITAADSGVLQDRLGHFLAGSEDANVTNGHATSPEIAFLFSGHGATYVGMARGLYTAQPIFRNAIDRCAALLQSQIDRPLTQLLGIGPDAIETGELLSRMAYAQPALFAVQYALAELWRAWGIHPALVAGHSAGEYAAACFAGVFSLEDALRLVVARGRLMQSLAPGGAMVAVFTDEARVQAAIASYAATVSIAAVNGKTSIVVSGHANDLAVALAPLIAAGIETRQLDIAIAAHSPLIEPILDEFTRVANTVRYHPPQIGLVSTLTGALAQSEELCNPNYWRRHLRQPVRFADAMQELIDQGCTAFIEIGPHPTLLGMARRDTPEDFGIWLPSLRQGRDDWEQMLESLATLYVHGAAVDWQAFDRPYDLQNIVLPTYPFERRRYWAASASATHRLPSFDPASRWREVAAAAQRQSTQGPLDLNIGEFATKWRSLDALATAAITHALREIGLFNTTGERHTLPEIAELHAIAPTYQRLLRRWLGHLADDGLLLRDGDAFVSLAPQPDSLVSAQDAATIALADNQPLLDYVLRCVDHLAAIVTGAESALDTLFPAGSYETVDYIYHHWAVARYFNQIVSAAAMAVANSGRPIRVLEIGAGTGGTAAALLPNLPAERVEYYFTDVSDFFLARARERFAEHHFVHYGLLDIERSPLDQGYAANSFDLIVAANVLHATRNLDQTLQHAHSLLASGGVLIAYETTNHPRWFDITTGLIEGWQIFEDAWRDDNPLMTASRWDAALRANEFDQVLALPAADSAPTILGQSVMIARAPITQDESAVIAWLPRDVEHIIQLDTPTAMPGIAGSSLINELMTVLPNERHELLVEFVRQHTIRVLRLDHTQILERNARLMDIGVDSLMAVELRNRLRDGLGLTQKLPATLIFDHPTINAIAQMLADLLTPAEPVAAEPVLSKAEHMTCVSDMADMSDDEAEALLLKKLVELGG